MPAHPSRCGVRDVRAHPNALARRVLSVAEETGRTAIGRIVRTARPSRAKLALLRRHSEHGSPAALDLLALALGAMHLGRIVFLDGLDLFEGLPTLATEILVDRHRNEYLPGDLTPCDDPVSAGPSKARRFHCPHPILRPSFLRYGRYRGPESPCEGTSSPSPSKDLNTAPDRLGGGQALDH